MARIDSQAHLFERGSNVVDYWLAHAEGFEVGSARIGSERVERVIVDPTTGRAKGLIVHAPFRRRRLLRAEAFIAADPLRRRLHLERNSEQQTSPTGKEAISALVAMALWMQRTLPPLARRAALGIAGLWAWLQPHVLEAIGSASRFVPTACAATRAMLVWLRPRVRYAGAVACQVAISVCVLFAEVSRRLFTLVVSFTRTGTQGLRTRAGLLRRRGDPEAIDPRA
jgi:hypothetical protein